MKRLLPSLSQRRQIQRMMLVLADMLEELVSFALRQATQRIHNEGRIISLPRLLGCSFGALSASRRRTRRRDCGRCRSTVVRRVVEAIRLVKITRHAYGALAIALHLVSFRVLISGSCALTLDFRFLHGTQAVGTHRLLLTLGSLSSSVGAIGDHQLMVVVETARSRWLVGPKLCQRYAREAPRAKL